MPNFGPGFPTIPPATWLLLLPVIAVLGIFYWWFIQRVEVGSDEVLLLVRKVGSNLSRPEAGRSPGAEDASTQVVLYPELLTALGEKPDSTTYKGIRYESLGPGRYFFDPFFWERIKVPATVIPDGEIGIKVRLYGRSLPPGKVIATESDERGPLAGFIPAGRYNLNTFAYEVKRVKPVVIPERHVGVVTLYSGAEPENPNQYVVKDGERGVQPSVLPAGRAPINPYQGRVDVIDIGSHTLDLHGDEAIRFPSNDSFEIVVDCTVEYAIRQDMAPYVMVAIGDHDDIRDKLILPYAKSLSRIEGSKLAAREFISGESRTAFQTRIFEGLREQCYTQGIEIRATLIRRIVPPQEIASPISDRQLAGQQIMQYQSEMKVAQAEARLVEQEEMRKQNQELGEANRQVVTLTIESQQRKAVALTEANQRLEVARLGLEAARETAAALLSRGQAESEVVLLQYQAKADPLQEAIGAFGDGETYAQFYFYQKLAPAVRSVLASTDGTFGDIFRALSATSPGKPPLPKPASAARGAAEQAQPAPSNGGAQ